MQILSKISEKESYIESLTTLNCFAPEPPVRIHVLSTACDVISFNGQGQLCPLTCVE